MMQSIDVARWVSVLGRRTVKVMGESPAAARFQPRHVVARRLRRKAGTTRRIGSDLYTSLLLRSAEDVVRGGHCWGVLEGAQNEARDSGLAVRFLAAAHRLVLEGRAPNLARHYPSVGGDGDAESAWRQFLQTMNEHQDVLRGLLQHPVQRNEVTRCGAFLCGFLELAEMWRLPLRTFEIGSSAGLNLLWDRFYYEGEWSWGDSQSPVRLRWEVRGPPPIDAPVEVVEQGGCDVAPVDPTSEEGRMRLMALVWADQTEEMDALRAALDLASCHDLPSVDRADAADWTEELLAHPVQGAGTVVFHSSVMQFLGERGRSRILETLERAGSRATEDAPIAHLRIEPDRPTNALRLTTWPGGRDRVVARTGPVTGRPVHLTTR